MAIWACSNRIAAAVVDIDAAGGADEAIGGELVVVVGTVANVAVVDAFAGAVEAANAVVIADAVFVAYTVVVAASADTVADVGANFYRGYSYYRCC